MLKWLFKSFNRRITYIYHRYILLNLFIFPYLKKKNLINERFKIRYSFGGLILQGKKNTLKIGIGKLQTINKEHKLRLLAVEKWPILDEIIVPHDLIQHQKFPILIIPTYSKINQNEIKNSAVKIFNIMKKLSDKHSVYPNHEKNENISLGLNMIKKMYTLDAYFLLKQIVKNYFANTINSYGFSHGDFHQSNIMIDFNKNIKLIDLDSIRLNGIQDFDALHFVLEHFWAKILFTGQSRYQI